MSVWELELKLLLQATDRGTGQVKSKQQIEGKKESKQETEREGESMRKRERVGKSEKE